MYNNYILGVFVIHYLIYANNEESIVLARIFDECRDNYEKLAKRVSHSYLHRLSSSHA